MGVQYACLLQEHYKTCNMNYFADLSSELLCPLKMLIPMRTKPILYQVPSSSASLEHNEISKGGADRGIEGYKSLLEEGRVNRC